MKKNKAFTLVEILLALAILGIGLVSILSLFALGVHSARRVLDLTRASLLAQTTFEDLKVYSITNFNNIATGMNVDLVSVIPSEYGGLGFSRVLTVTPDPLGTGTSQVKKINLLITWNNNNSSDTFVTNVTKYSP